MAHWRCSHGLTVGALVLGGAASCMLTSPLDDLPGAPETDEGEGGAFEPAPSAHAGGGAGGSTSMNEAGQSGGPWLIDGECRDNADCAEGSGGVLYRCRPSDHTCQPLKTGECPLAEGDAADPNAIFFGAFANLGTVAPKNNAIVQAHLLALDDFSGKNVGGLPAGPGAPRRPLVMVVCNNSATAVEEGLRHLVEDLEVPAVLATLKPEDLRRGFEKHGSREVFFLSPVSVTKTLVNEDDHGLIWNLLGQPADFGPAYIKLLEHMEHHVRHYTHGTLSMPLTTPIRVALVTTGDAFDSELEDVIAPQLTFNGDPTSVNQTKGNYLGIEVPSDGADLDELAEQIVLFRPHIIVSMAGSVMTVAQGLINKIEDNWEVPLEIQPLPLYLLSPYNSGDLAYINTRIHENWQTSDEEIAQDRFVGIAIASAENSSLQNAYAVRLGNKFGDVYSDTANYYDAFYFLAYATFAAGTAQPLTGAGIARGMKRLLSGPSFDPVPTAISDVFATLAEPETTIRLESTLGPPGFNEVTGSRPIEASLLCFARNDAQITLERDVRRFDRAQNEFVGEAPFCSSNLVP
jgi:hypothetical protein